jgi:hypothetical protein
VSARRERLSPHVLKTARPSRRAPRTLAAVLVFALGSLSPATTGQEQGCNTKAEAVRTLDGIREEITALYRETSALERNLEDALAVRAKESGWDEAQVAAFRRGLLESDTYQALERKRAEGSLDLMRAAAQVISAATASDTATVCREARSLRDVSRALRSTLDRQYAHLRVKLWGSSNP